MATLKNLPSFQSILADYKMSAEAKRTLQDLSLVLLVAPTSSGRNTIINQLIKTGDYYFVVSDTTRKPRTNNNVTEQDGVTYWFRSEEAVLGDLEKGLFLEAAIIHDQQVSGISIRELQKAKSSGKVAITDIEIAGVDSVVKAKDDTTIIFIVPPNFELWHERLEERGKMNEDELRRRMRSACSEFRHALANESEYFFVVNDKLDDTVEHIHQIVFSQQKNPVYQNTAKQIIEHLLVDTEKFLSGSSSK